MESQPQPKPKHTSPPSGRTMSGADMIVEVLAGEGVDTIFGYSGGAILPTYDSVFRYNAAHGEADGLRLVDAQRPRRPGRARAALQLRRGAAVL